MVENKLRDELADSRAEIARLKERLASVMPTMHKDLSLISLVPKWSGAETSTPFEKFLSSIETAAKIGNWSENDCLDIAVLRLQDPAVILQFEFGIPCRRRDMVRRSKLLSEKGSKTCVPTSTTSLDSKLRNNRKMKVHKILLTGAEVWHRKLSKTNDPVTQRIHGKTGRVCV